MGRRKQMCGLAFATRYLMLIMTFALLNGCELSPEPEGLQGEESNSSLEVRYGTSFGMCIEYCVHEIATSGESVRLTRSGWDKTQFPEQEFVRDIDESVWTEITREIDLEELARMDDVYGCPDCADGGAGWLEVRTDDFQKKVTFEYGNPPAGIANAVEDLSALMEEIRASIDE